MERVHFVRGTASQLPLGDGSCTAVLCTTPFHHHPDPAASMAEMARVLAPGGRLALADFSTDSWQVRIADWLMRRWDRDHVGLPSTPSLLAHAARAGLVEARVVSLLPGDRYVALLAARR